MEARHCLSTLGRTGELRLWIAAICFLSSRIVDIRRGAERDFPVDGGVGHRYLDCARRSRRVDVFSSAGMV